MSKTAFEVAYEIRKAPGVITPRLNDQETHQEWQQRAIDIVSADAERISAPLSKREQFSALAMQGYCSNPDITESNGEKQIAVYAVSMSDALIAELAKTEGGK